MYRTLRRASIRAGKRNRKMLLSGGATLISAYEAGNRIFGAIKYLGWTPTRAGSSATVALSRNAVSTTLALKAGPVCVGR
jgi:hypothetical protein